MKDECAICGRVLSLYSLNRCSRCKKLYCRSCMTTNLWNEQRDLLCLNCARRIVSPKFHGSKYSPLRDYLWRRGKITTEVSLSFLEIEEIINGNLPLNALHNEQWWSNTDSTTQGYSWTNAGWRVQNVDLNKKTVTYRKLKKLELEKTPRRKTRTKSQQKPFAPVPVRPRRVKRPSKTRIAKTIARARNIERRKTAYRKIKLKPKSPYEKKTYKQGARPSSQD